MPLMYKRNILTKQTSVKIIIEMKIYKIQIS